MKEPNEEELTEYKVDRFQLGDIVAALLFVALAVFIAWLVITVL